MTEGRTKLHQRFLEPGPKRILSLDGGGIRGALMLGFVERIEQLLRERHRDPDLRLSDYFDLIGGTSTGAIVAAALAIGMSVADVKKSYLESDIHSFLFRLKPLVLKNLLDLFLIMNSFNQRP